MKKGEGGIKEEAIQQGFQKLIEENQKSSGRQLLVEGHCGHLGRDSERERESGGKGLNKPSTSRYFLSIRESEGWLSTKRIRGRKKRNNQRKKTENRFALT